MASELIQLAFGALTVEKRAPVDGVRMRDVVPTDLVSALEPALVRAPDHLRFMTSLVGAYPFQTYGSFISDATFPFALEDQTISLYPVAWFTPSPTVPYYGDPRFYEAIMVHELAHQWFGDSVTPERWSDVWLNEGHATWYEWAWAVASGNARWYLGGTLEQRMHFTYTQGDTWRAIWGPVAMPSHGHDNVAQIQPEHLRRRRARPLRPARGGRRRDLQGDRARLGGALPLRPGQHRGLHRPGLRGRRARPRAVPARLAVRHHHPADARAPALAGRARR
jgi:hypothetical protein